MELNPDHPVIKQIHDQWHSICFLIMKKLGVSEVRITSADVAKIEPEKEAITIQEKDNQLVITIRSMDEAKRMLEQDEANRKSKL